MGDCDPLNTGWSFYIYHTLETSWTSGSLKLVHQFIQGQHLTGINHDVTHWYFRNGVQMMSKSQVNGASSATLHSVDRDNNNIFDIASHQTIGNFDGWHHDFYPMPEISDFQHTNSEYAKSGHGFEPQSDLELSFAEILILLKITPWMW
jgi:hypothetical protein